MRRLIFLVGAASDGLLVAESCLLRAGFGVNRIPTLAADEAIDLGHPDLVLIVATCGEGVDISRKVRQHASLRRTPVVLLLEQATEDRRVFALESGFDDCMALPFAPEELVTRLEAVLRDPAGVAERRADLVIDSSAMRLMVRGSEVPATTLEFRLIDYLARHRGQVFTRDLLLDVVWGDMQFLTPRTVDACIRRVREKIEPNRDLPTYLRTVRGVGYRFDARVVWQQPDRRVCACKACSKVRGSDATSARRSLSVA